ncbi:neuritin-like protein isoform X1 [Alligator sinensis]|uniref:Neuritin-like protein isoform X1 n=2 Tax=Alligator sinensis TaxID=38654 RepID=A0A3Q0HLN1_ALLSI|nr:neuritin-like protein isoform X1 [Alligator sinensis]
MGLGVRGVGGLCSDSPVFCAAVAEEPVSMAGRGCDTIYKGFAGCLISLGDSMAQSVQRQQEDSGQEVQELDTICRSWDDFHTCATGVLSSCPEEAAAIWESLRQKSRKIQFQGNLYDLCSSRTKLSSSARGSDTDETNKETLRGSAQLPQPGLLASLPLLALLAPFV